MSVVTGVTGVTVQMASINGENFGLVQSVPLMTVGLSALADPTPADAKRV
jgi:hypothetical protein